MAHKRTAYLALEEENNFASVGELLETILLQQILRGIVTTVVRFIASEPRLSRQYMIGTPQATEAVQFTSKHWR
jgi:hypothetical protein